jgi:3-hydroxybutyryl-CoA dehydrogenase
MDANDVKHVLVVGAGVMGHSIAQVFAQAGIETALMDLDDKVLEHGVSLIKSNLTTLAEYGTISEEEIPSILKRVHPTTDLASSAKKADFAIEAVSEVPEVKKKVFLQLSASCQKDTVIASNTSGLNIFNMADIRYPERLVIAHWYAPAHIIPLVEVVPGPDTSPDVVSYTARLMENIGKQPAIMKEFVTGFIANKINFAIGLAALEMLENGVASPEEIDRAVKFSLGIRLPIVGVMQSMDFNGLDLVQNILKGLNSKNSLINERVDQGNLGVKTSKGIYDYEGRSEEEVLKKRDLLYLKMVDHLKEIKGFEPV